MKNNDDFDVVLLSDSKEFNHKVDFYELLNEEMKKELGEINSSWFDEAFTDASSPLPIGKRHDDSNLLQNDVSDLQNSVSDQQNNISEQQNDVSDLRIDNVARKSVNVSEVDEVVIEKKEEDPKLRSLVNDVTPPLSPLGFFWSPLTSVSQTVQRNRHSTPSFIALSLGASIGGHEMSWTSSMATPDSSFTINKRNKVVNSTTDISKNGREIIVSETGSLTPVCELCREVTKSPEEEKNCSTTLSRLSNLDIKADLPEIASFEPKLSSNKNANGNAICENVSGTVSTCDCKERKTNESTDEIKTDQREVNSNMTTPKLLKRTKLKRRRMIDVKDQLITEQSEVSTSQSSPRVELYIQYLPIPTNNVEVESPFVGSYNCGSHNLVRATADHDYTKTIKQDKESGDDYDSLNMNGFTQIVEVLDSTVALFEDMKNGSFTPRSPDKKRICVETVSDQFSKGAIAREEHNVSNVISQEKRKEIVTICSEKPTVGCRDTRSNSETSTARASKGQSQLVKPVETQDYSFWDSEFPECEQSDANVDAAGPSSPLLIYDDDFFDDETDFDATPARNGKSTVLQKDLKDVAMESKGSEATIIEEDWKENKRAGNVKSFQGFVAASGKVINVSEESLSNARKAYNNLLLQEEFQNDLPPVPNRNRSLLVEQRTEQSKSFTLKGFSTASRKPVKVTEESLKRAKQLHYDQTQEMDFKCGVTDQQLVTTSEIAEKQYKRISETAVCVQSVINGNPKLTSKEPDVNECLVRNAVERVISIVEDSDVEIKPDSISSMVGFGGFTTARGSSISISKKALERARMLHREDLEQILTEEKSTVDKSITENPQKSEYKGSFSAFSTASGKTCSVTNESMEKARKLYECHQIQDGNEECGAGDGSVLVTKCKTRGVKRFRNEKTVEKPTKLAYQSCSNNILDITPKEAVYGSVDDMKTNNGVAVEISEDSMDAAEALIAMFNCHGHSTSNVSTVATPFKLANEKPVRVSSQSFEQVTRLEQTTTIGANVTSCFDEDTSKNYLSVELEESTAALLEDELEVSGDTSLGNRANFSKHRRIPDPDTPVLSTNASRKNCKRVLCESMNGSFPNGCEQISLGHDTTRHRDTIISSAASCSTEVLQRRKKAIDEQQLRIASKSTQKIIPITGELYKKKSDKCDRMSLKKFLLSDTPKRLLDQNVLKRRLVKLSTQGVRSRNAMEFCFSLDEHFADFSNSEVGIFEFEDGALLILGERNTAGKDEFYRSLVDCPGVDPKLISKEWVFNHYRWIVWKLAAYEVAFPHTFAGRCLTPARVMSELRYRVNREIDFSQRSALKRITERDDTSMKTMILCVSHIICEDSENCTGNLINLEVTDGWYSVVAALDKPLSSLVKRGKIGVGQKLIVHGAEGVSSAEACPPLEVSKCPFLKFSYNSCRLARFDARLGFFRSPRPFPLPLSCLSPDGGVVGRVDVIIARVYPIQFLEKLHDGSFVVYNRKANELADRGNENEKSEIMGRLVTDVQAKLEQEELQQVRKRQNVSGTRSHTREYVKGLCEGEELAEAMRSLADPSFFASCLSATQKSTLIAYNERLNERRQARLQSQLSKAIQMRQEKGELPVERNVVPFLKVRAVGIHEKDRRSNTTCTISIWRPSEVLKSIVEEGKCLQIYYLAADHRSYGRELALKTVKMTKFEEMSSDNEVTSSFYVTRKFTTFSEMSSHDFCPAYGDVDIVGVVVSVGNLGSQPGSKFEISYLANCNRDVIGVKFWGGRKAFGCESVVEPGSFIAAHNLQWRGREKSVIPCVHASELSIFTRSPKDREGKHAVDVLRSSISDLQSFIDQCKDRIGNIMQNDCLSPTGSILQGNGHPQFTSTPLSNRSNYRTPTTLRVVRSDPILCKMKQLQNLSGLVPQLNALPSPNSPSVRSKYKVPISKASAKK